jgi:hypothetical protein
MSAEILSSLNAFLLDPELHELERRLYRFSLLRLLRSENREICHSNVLAWLIEPAEAHGFGDLFLRRWLMRVAHDSHRADCADLPARLDSGTLESVAVQREWPAGSGYLDIFIRLRSSGKNEWIIALENKINAPQGPVQLKGYREAVESAFPNAEKRIFIFLSRRREKPADPAWIEADYRQVANELQHSIEACPLPGDADAASFVRHYARLLKDMDMEEKQVAELVKIIYKKHRRAIETILEHKPDFVSELTTILAGWISQDAKTLRLVPRLSIGPNVRFMPEEWDTPDNRMGNAWGDDESAYVLCQITLRENSAPRLDIVEGGWLADRKPTADWRKKLWKLAQVEGWKRTVGREPPRGWTHLLSIEADFSLGDENAVAAKVQAEKVFTWLEAEIKKTEFRSATEKIAKIVRSIPSR